MTISADQGAGDAAVQPNSSVDKEEERLRRKEERKEKRKEGQRKRKEELRRQKEEEQNADRKRAMVLGLFTFMNEETNAVLDDNNPELQATIKAWKAACTATAAIDGEDRKLKLRVQYEPLHVDAEGKKTRQPRKAIGFDTLRVPKATSNPDDPAFKVLWANRKGQVVIEDDVLLMNMKEVVMSMMTGSMGNVRDDKFGWYQHEEDKEMRFDSDLFWTVGFLYKYFKSCGILGWDRQMAGMRKELYRASEVSASVSVKKGKQSGKYSGKLITWKGTYGFMQVTNGDLKGETMFLHQTEITSPYLRLDKGTQFRFDVVEESDGKLRAVKAKMCLCRFSCQFCGDSDKAVKAKDSEVKTRGSNGKGGRRPGGKRGNDESGNENQSTEESVVKGKVGGRPKSGRGFGRRRRRPSKTTSEAPSQPPAKENKVGEAGEGGAGKPQRRRNNSRRSSGTGSRRSAQSEVAA